MSDVTIPIHEALACIVAIQKELDASSNAQPFFVYQQAGTPYWQNRQGRTEATKLGGRDYLISVTIEMSYHAGPMTSKYVGKLEQAIQLLIPVVLIRFLELPELYSDAFPDGLESVIPDSLKCVSRGLGRLPSPEGENMGTIFDLTVDFGIELD